MAWRNFPPTSRFDIGSLVNVDEQDVYFQLRPNRNSLKPNYPAIRYQICFLT